MSESLKINVQSEIGKLEAVILRTPGAEVENMTPGTAQRALYSDILNLSIAQHEYTQLSGGLEKYTKTYQIEELLRKVLEEPQCRESLISKICINEGATDYYEDLMEMNSKSLAKCLIEGVPAKINSLTAYLKDEYYALYPLYNFYFTRDASVSLGNNVIICKMANKVRVRESLIMEAIFKNSGAFDCGLINIPEMNPGNSGVFMEGGDVLVAAEDIILVGNGLRTSTQGIDSLISFLCKQKREKKKHIIVQQLPHSPESFIHLDMVFTLLDKDKCMVFEPLILGDSNYQTVHITIENGKVSKIKTVSNILTVLRRLGMDLEPILCGGEDDEWDQEREQWHSGSNFFAFAPGKVVCYARNEATVEQMSKHSFEIIPAWDVIEGKVSLSDYQRCCVTLEG